MFTGGRGDSEPVVGDAYVGESVIPPPLSQYIHEEYLTTDYHPRVVGQLYPTSAERVLNILLSSGSLQSDF